MESLWEATNPRGVDPESSQFESARSERITSDHRTDVIIVGGGYTGLWTARYLADADPSLRITIVDANRCGFGASSRNGGWCSALFPTHHQSLVTTFGASAANAQRDAMRASIDEVGAAAASDGIDCSFTKGGTLVMATNPAHVPRLRDHLEEGEIWLGRDDARSRVNAQSVEGATYTPHCAALHPARLASGLIDAVGSRGVEIFEGSPVAAIAPGAAMLADGTTIRARTVLRCTEGYTSSIRGHRRSLVPLYSLMIATAPLSDAVWDSIGLANRETFSDGRHMLIYGQRTADGRFAFGGRGAPYHLGSRVRPAYDTDTRVFVELERVLRSLFPQIGDVAITHRWGGALGVPRDWMASVGFDRASRMGWAGGYVGDGVSTSNLAGRTLRDLVLGADTELTALPWVDHRSRKWEPEPLRWTGINIGRAVAGLADRYEDRSRQPAQLAERAMGWFTGG